MAMAMGGAAAADAPPFFIRYWPLLIRQKATWIIFCAHDWSNCGPVEYFDENFSPSARQFRVVQHVSSTAFQ